MAKAVDKENRSGQNAFLFLKIVPLSLEAIEVTRTMPQVEILFLKNAGKWGKGAVGGIGCSNRLIFSVREYVFFIRVWVYR